MSGKLDGRSYAGTLKNFQSTHIGYRAHRAVIFAIAWHLVVKIITSLRSHFSLSDAVLNSLRYYVASILTVVIIPTSSCKITS